MPVTIVEEATEHGIAIDPNGFDPIPGSKCLRTIDVASLCHKASPGNLAHITYGVIKHPKTGEDERCLRFVWFVGCGTEFGSKFVVAYPQAATIWTLRKFLSGRIAETLGCDAEQMATAIAEHAPWH